MCNPFLICPTIHVARRKCTPPALHTVVYRVARCRVARCSVLLRPNSATPGIARVTITNVPTTTTFRPSRFVNPFAYSSGPVECRYMPAEKQRQHGGNPRIPCMLLLVAVPICVQNKFTGIIVSGNRQFSTSTVEERLLHCKHNSTLCPSC